MSEEGMMDLSKAHDSVNECWQKAEDVEDWLTKERMGRVEYQRVIEQLAAAMNHLDIAANLLEELKG